MAAKSISEHLRCYLSPVNGIVGIYVSDKDGVRIVDVSIEDASEHAFKPFVVTTFMNSLEQFAKLGFGKVENMLSKYQEMTLFQSVYVHSLNTPPLYLTVVGTGTCDLGMNLFLSLIFCIFLYNDKIVRDI
ncbi:unnamed protein product [Hymenolepis diminuta]|uniref:Roadblock/LAMTOR2 domain-containing protein n=1 Tax=Hymenolepis diminuta TaxID=6216 RepID=A0A564ZA31_HYMDI|nr:unnamed protein product [Hymenolepis diminuta]